MSSENLRPVSGRLTSRAKSRLTKTKQSANKRNKDFDLTLEYMVNILRQTRCAYSGEKFSVNMGPDLMTLERLDCDKGYVIGNVVPVKHKYNNLRGDLTFEQLCGQGYSKKAEAASLDRPETLRGKAKNHYRTIQRIRSNQAGRKNKIKELQAKESLTEQDQAVLNSCLKRLESSEIEVNHLIALIEKELKAAKSDLRRKVKTAKNAAEGYSIIAQGLFKFINATPAQIENLKKGLPLEGDLCTTDMLSITETKTDLKSQSQPKAPSNSSWWSRILKQLKFFFKKNKTNLELCFTPSHMK